MMAELQSRDPRKVEAGLGEDENILEEKYNLWLGVLGRWHDYQWHQSEFVSMLYTLFV